MKRRDRSMRWGREVRLAIAFAAALMLGLAGASTATAALVVNVTPMFPATTAVGETAPANVTITNLSFGAEAATPVAVPGVTLFPSCGSGAAITCTAPDPGVYQLDGPFTVTGSAGAVCPTSYTVSAPDPATGAVTFTPVGETLLDAGESCTFSFNATVLKAPTIDAAG